MYIGYARVSTQDQVLDRQLDALKQAGCQKIYKEKVTGKKKERPELQKMIEFARPGDTIVVADLTRLSRTTKDLFALVEELNAKGINLKSLKESWMDTTTAQGKLMFTIIAGLSQFERDLVTERTKEGLAAARARGRKGGRPAAKTENIEKAIMYYNLKTVSVGDICKMCNISKQTLYNYVKKEKVIEAMVKLAKK